MPCEEKHGRLAEKCSTPVGSCYSLHRYYTVEDLGSHCTGDEEIHGEILAAEEACYYYLAQTIASLG